MVSWWWVVTGILATVTLFLTAKVGKGTGGFMDMSGIFGLIVFLMGVVAIMGMWLIKGKEQTGCSLIWQSAAFGTLRLRVRISPS